METLSEHFRQMISDMDAELINDAPSDERQQVVEWLSEMSAYLLESLEGFSVRKEAAFEKLLSSRLLRPHLESQFDDYYTRWLLNRVPKMVSRTLKLSPMFGRVIPSPATHHYVKEATRAFVLGFCQGSVALSRAAVEQGLKEAVGNKIALSNPKLTDLITAALKLRLLDDEHSRMASRVAAAGNTVLHGKPSNETESLNVLSAARTVLLYLYGDEN